ncbi:MAG: hypothetical protein V4507_02215 [Verrucomicrobiota bacterium]
MSSHTPPPPADGPAKASEPKGFHDPLQEDPYLDDIEFSHESTKERVFGYLKWVIFLGGIGAALYYGGAILKGYWVSDLEQKLSIKSQEVDVLKQSSHEGSSSPSAVSFDVVVKQVTSSPRGKAYLVSDAMGQPWFALSGKDFKTGEKVSLEIKMEEGGKSVQVSLKSISSSASAGEAPVSHGKEAEKHVSESHEFVSHEKEHGSAEHTPEHH